MTAPPPTGPRPPRYRLERLYVLWIGSSVALLLLLVALAVFGSGQLRHQARLIARQDETIAELRRQLADAHQRLAELAAAQAVRRAATAAASRPATTASASAPAPVSERPRPTSVAAADTGRRVAGLLRAALRLRPDDLYEVADQEAAEAALRAGRENLGRQEWQGKVWSQLAILAALLGDQPLAETFAYAAVRSGTVPDTYYELVGRELLSRGQLADALVCARRLAAGCPGDPRAALLLAEVRYARRELGAVADALCELRGVEQLRPSALLRLGRLYVALEDWSGLERVLDHLRSVPTPLLPQRNGLRARLLIEQGRLPEALATLDHLLAERAPGALRLPPDEYDLRIWRAVALLEAGRLEAAREALAHVADQPQRPEGWYWQGMLELRGGNVEAAIASFSKALSAAQGFAPAWEALGTIALNAGELAAAAQNLSNAIEADPSRASAHFLLAAAQAMAGRAEEARVALRAALRLDPTLREAAAGRPEFRKLFGEQGLAELLGAAASAPAESGQPATP